MQIAVRSTTLSRELKQVVRRRANKLTRFYPRLTACRVMIEIPQRHRIGTPIGYNVRVDLTVPGGELVVKRQPRAALRAAVRDAFAAAERRLQDYARRRRGRRAA